MQDLAKGLKGKHKLKTQKNLSDKSFIPPPLPPPPPRKVVHSCERGR